MQHQHGENVVPELQWILLFIPFRREPLIHKKKRTYKVYKVKDRRKMERKTNFPSGKTINSPFGMNEDVSEGN